MLFTEMLRKCSSEQTSFDRASHFVERDALPSLPARQNPHNDNRQMQCKNFLSQNKASKFRVLFDCLARAFQVGREFFFGTQPWVDSYKTKFFLHFCF